MLLDYIFDIRREPKSPRRRCRWTQALLREGFLLKILLNIKSTATETGFLRVCQSPFPILIPHTTPHSSSSRAGTVGRRTEWTVSPQPTNQNKLKTPQSNFRQTVIYSNIPEIFPDGMEETAAISNGIVRDYRDSNRTPHSQHYHLAECSVDNCTVLALQLGF
jgi:hypothetical protein